MTTVAPVTSLQSVPVVDDFQRRREDARSAFLEKARAMTSAAAAGDLDDLNLYEVIDRAAELDVVLDEWCGVEDEYERQRG
ncbi:hypothetical protein SAMN05880568_3477 [Microbacterium sp. RURRCA19A]|nr:hypothetical protein SAMN05880568_3477 [Microbacterium sp. RURRCA19A]